MKVRVKKALGKGRIKAAVSAKSPVQKVGRSSATTKAKPGSSKIVAKKLQSKLAEQSLIQKPKFKTSFRTKGLVVDLGQYYPELKKHSSKSKVKNVGSSNVVSPTVNRETAIALAKKIGLVTPTGKQGSRYTRRTIDLDN